MIKLKSLLKESVDLEKYGIHFLSNRGLYDSVVIPFELFKGVIKDIIPSKIKPYKDVPGCDKGYEESEEDGVTILYIERGISNEVLLAIREVIAKKVEKLDKKLKTGGRDSKPKVLAGSMPVN